MLAAVLHIHYEVDYIQALSVGLAVAAKALRSMCFIVHLQARSLIIVEWAAQPQLLVWFEVVVVQDLGKGETAFDVCYLH